MSTESIADLDGLKARIRGTWMSGDYDRCATYGTGCRGVHFPVVVSNPVPRFSMWRVARVILPSPRQRQAR